MVGFGTFEGTEFVRLVTINTTLQEEDILNFFKVIENFCKQTDPKRLNTENC
jgi:hypothetical protein